MPTIALLGNPNTGKSTLFSALAGVSQRTGNYPGVTVEKKTGQMRTVDGPIDLVDLPGTYSLAPRSPDEMVAVDVLLGRDMGGGRADPRPDAILCILDASNLERNLYLVSQLLELGLPVVIALNMVDLAKKRGDEINVQLLAGRLKVPVVVTQANRRVGIDQLRTELGRATQRKAMPFETPLPLVFREAAGRLAESCAGHEIELPPYLLERLLLDTNGYLQNHLDPEQRLDEVLKKARDALSAAGTPVPGIEAISRYQWVAEMTQGVVKRPKVRPTNWSDNVDRFLTHRVFGTLFFVVLMIVIFQSVFSWAGPLMDRVEGGIGRIGGWAAGFWQTDSPLKSLLVDGVIAGVGGVLVFLPQICILFLFIAVLEDCGYMSRAAYLMDRLMSRIGLSGKSFIPLLSSFACAIPGIMATRVIENRRDRLITILVAPLMSCSARLPVYTVLIGAFIPATAYLGGWLTLQGLTMMGMYSLGVVAAIVVALLLKKTILRGETPPFVMELPSYKWPSLRIVVGRVVDRGWAFVRRAGTLIFAVSIVVWAAAYYPRYAGPDSQKLDEQIAALPQQETEETQQHRTELKNRKAGLQIRNSFLGRAGQWVEPAVQPLGWDWRVGCAAIASFPAREVVIGTLSVIYNLGDEGDEASLSERLKSSTWEGTDRKVFNVPVALSLMVFFALCAQCAATLAVIKRETNSWRWPIFTFVYMTGIAYLGALLTYQIGSSLVS